MAPLTEKDRRRLFALLNEELEQSGKDAELFLVGGAVMCVAYAALASTQGVDAVKGFMSTLAELLPAEGQ